jgi:hypothetical protein
MRRFALALAVAALPAVSFAASLGVPLDQAVIVSLPAAAHDVVIGNPSIADVQISDQRHLVVTGKSGGVTNLVVDDAAGHVIFDRQIVVGTSSGDRVQIIHGAQIISYACAPICEQVGSTGAPQAAAAPTASSTAPPPQNGTSIPAPGAP